MSAYLELQLDLFATPAVRLEIVRPPVDAGAPPSLAEISDDALVAAIPGSGLSTGPALAAEAGRRRLAAAVPALEALCARFCGFGLERAVPEQAAAIEALRAIGGQNAAQAVARLITRSIVQGPGLRGAVTAAAELRSNLPTAIVSSLLRHPDPGVRAAACRCARPDPKVISVLIDLLGDLNGDVARSAACALGGMGRTEARTTLARLLHEAPSAEIIDASASIADEDCIVRLGRIARELPDLAAVALDALADIDHPRASAIAATLGKRNIG
jgi:hypothetical protein